MSKQQTVLVTGASQGIGAAAVELLATKGYRVFGTSRKDSPASAPGVEMLKLDVTDDASVAACLAEVHQRAGQLDVLVNNAGYAHNGPLENTTVNDLRAQFETNLYGVHRMVQAVLPEMTARKSGRIVNISSAIGRVAVPFMSTYCSSKFALEGYSEGLAKELAPLGIQVVIMEPGLTATEFHAHSTQAAGVAEHYQARIAEMQQAFPEMLKGADSADAVARVILSAVTDEQPELRYLAPAAQAMLGAAH